MNTGLMFSSSSDMWETPDDLFERLDQVFGFEIDVCAVDGNAKCKKFYPPKVDGLRQKWEGVCWMNPPYGREISKWVAKAYYESKHNRATIVCLLPARTDTKWWHDYCMKGEIYFIKGRLKFGASNNSAPFPSCIVVFRSRVEDAFEG